MKRLRYIIVLIAMVAMSAALYADNNAVARPLFDKIRAEYGIEHSFMSKMMLRKMADQEGEIKGIPAKNLDIVEVVSMKYSAYNYIEPVIKRLIPEMDLYGANTSNDGGYSEIYVLCKDSKTFSKILVINWGKYRNSAKVLYMEGNIPAEKVNFDSM